MQVEALQYKYLVWGICGLTIGVYCIKNIIELNNQLFSVNQIYFYLYILNKMVFEEFNNINELNKTRTELGNIK